LDDDEKNPDDELPLEDEALNIADLGFTLVYDPYELGMEDLASDFSKDFEKKSASELETKEYSDAKKDKYRIFIGKIASDKNSSNEAKRLKEITDSVSGAYSIKLSGTTLMITGTSATETERALEYLISLFKDGDLIIDKNFSKTEIHYRSGGKEYVFSEDEFKSCAFLAEIKIAGERLSGFSSEKAEYEFKYSSTENYPEAYTKSLNSEAQVEITPPDDNNGVLKISVSSQDGKENMVYEITYTYADTAEISAEIVNKDAKRGVITLVFDDGDLRSADIILSKLMKKYPSVRPSFAIICNQLATAEKQGDDYRLTPIKYGYDPISQSVFSKYTYKYEYWKRAAEIEGVDVLSHSYSHTGEGISADPFFELRASQQILRELCGADSYTYVIPGAGTIENIEEYYSALDGGTIYIGARATGKKMNLASDYNPFRVGAYAINRYETKLSENGLGYTTSDASSKELCLAAGISEWENYINSALDVGAWACFCIHSLVPKGMDSTAKWFIYEEQAEALFQYVDGLSDSGEAWVANFTEASIYYAEWKDAVIEASVKGTESVSVKITDTLDDEIFNMPLTVKVSVPKEWSTAHIASTEYQVFENDDGTKYVYVNIVPGSDAITITK